MPQSDGMMPFGDHLEELRRVLFRVIAVSVSLALVVFFCKDAVWRWLLAPSDSSFATYRAITSTLHLLGFSDFAFEEFHVEFVATELPAQFMAHVSTSLYLGLLLASPYVIWQLFGFVAPALRERELHYGRCFALVVYLLFLSGLLMSYFVLFPVSFRFLGTYSVSQQVHTMIAIDSYVSTFITLTLVTGLSFQLPVLTFLLARFGLVRADALVRYRRHALILILLLSAVITPPDILSLLLVSLPLYLLYELSIRVA